MVYTTDLSNTMLSSNLLDLGLDILLLAITIIYVGRLLMLSFRETGLSRSVLLEQVINVKNAQRAKFTIGAFDGIQNIVGSKRSLLDQHVESRYLSA